MIKNAQLKHYNKKYDYSYSLGAFPTIELLKQKPGEVIKILIHTDMNSLEQKQIIHNYCELHEIPIEENCNRVIEKIRDKDNCYVVGVFGKYKGSINMDNSHVVLVQPSDMGNMGTIIRTCIGFGIKDLAVIEPAVDIFNPRVIRASMGSIFQLNFQYFSSYEEYKKGCGKRMVYPFMLEGAVPLQTLERDTKEKFSLVFGNEATGLSKEFLKEGKSIFIKHTDQIDSLNLSLAAGIGIYEFMK